MTDNCDQECGWVQCGDVCLYSMTGKWCHCGEKRLDLNRGQHYCCVHHSFDNRTQCSVDRYGHGSCPKGRVMDKRDTCYNHCFNDYETSAVVGWQSLYRCGDQCLQVINMCRGHPLCPDFRDVSECDEDLKCFVVPGRRTNRRSVLVSDLTGGHYYCDYDVFHNNGR